jgi:tetratricopeptide (TPR) repeat protein
MKAIHIGFIIFLTALSNSFAGEMAVEAIQSCYHQSLKHEAQKRYVAAIADLKPIYLHYPNTYTVNYRLGWLFYLNKNYANAIDHLNKATVILPQSIDSTRIKIYIYQAKDDWVEVETLSVQILKKDYYNICGNYWYSVALKIQGKFALSIKIANKMLAIQPTSEIFLQELAENLFLCASVDDSYALFTNLYILYPHNKTALYYLKKIGELKEKEALNKKERNTIYGKQIHIRDQKKGDS